LLPCHQTLFRCHHALLFYLANWWALLPYHRTLVLCFVGCWLILFAFFKYLRHLTFVALLLAPCSLPSHLVVLPCWLLVACHYYSPFSSTSYPPPPIVASLPYCLLSHFVTMPC
jgi:hypothetical protein